MFSSVLLFFDIGGGEIMLILFVVLLLFGGEKLPQLARGLGKGIRDFKDASEGVKREITNQIDNFEAKKAEQASATTDNSPTPASEALVPVVAAEVPAVQEPVPNTTPVANTMPVAEIHSSAQIHSDADIAPVKTESIAAEQVHLRETPIEPAKPEQEYKS